jgi:ubiquinol-cytochrome c reductase cytochrome b subunit
VTTKKLCLALQARDHETEHHGIETGIIRQLPTGEFVEDHRPKPAPVPDYPQVPTHRFELPAAGAHAEEPGKGGLATRARRAVTGFFTEEKTESGEEPVH